VHHPCEIAQNQAHEGSADSGARIWMHNNFLIDRRGKMSKSSGEFLRLQTLVDRGFHPLAYRLMCLQAHYRSEMEFTWEGLAAAFVRLKRMVMGVERLRHRANPSSMSVATAIESRMQRFEGSIFDDLNTSIALSLLEGTIEANMGITEVEEMLQVMDDVLGLNLLKSTRADLRIRPITATLTEADIEARLDERKAARAAKDFATSDRIRDELGAAGVEVMDGDPLGWDWKLDLP
jgi:cysteinyl-tRNA synthetase